MEAFSICCTTCRARLKVRDEAALGQILACPKCGSMVLVERPTGEEPSPPGGSSLNLAAMGGRSARAELTKAESTFDQVDSLLGEPGVPEVPAHRPAGRTDAAPQPAGRIRDPNKADRAGKPKPQERPSRTAAAAIPPIPAPPSAAAPAESPIAPSSSVPAAPVPPPAPAPVREPMEPAAPPAASAPVAASPGGPLPMNAPLHSPAAQLALRWLTYAAALVGGMVLAVGTWALVMRFMERPDPPIAQSTPAIGREATATGGQAARGTEAAPGTSPPIDPPQLAKVDHDEWAPAPGPPQVNPADTPFGEPGLPAVDPVSAPNPVEVTSGEPASPPKSPPAVSTSALDRPEPPRVDVAARLKDRIAGLEFRGVPLAEYLQFLSELSTIPITLEPAALQRAGIGPQTKVTVRLTDTTVAKALDEAILSHGLAYRVEGGHLVVGFPGEPEARLRKVRYAMEDLGGGDAETLAELARLVTGMVAPDAWDVRGGPGSVELEPGALLVAQDDAVHFEILVFCEKLRVARGLPPRSRHAPALFALESLASRAPLDAPVSVNFIQPTPLVRVLAALKQQSGTAILVDWRALAAIRWGTGAEGTLTAENLPLGAALAALLAPMELTYRAIDETTLEVTTPQALAARPEVEFHRLGTLAGSEEEGKAVVRRASEALGLAAAPSAGDPLHYDRAANCLIASLPHPRHAELAELLADWRAGEEG